MIKNITVNNVRVFDGRDFRFELAPLSIFCGTNSSGKSTIVKTLLLLRQSQGSNELYGKEQGRLRFVGPQVDLGDYSTFVSHNDTRKNIHIAITIENKMPKEMYLSFLKVHGIEADKTKIGEMVVYTLECRFVFTSSLKDNLITDDFMRPKVTGEEDEDSQEAPVKGILISADYRMNVKKDTLATWKVRLVESKEEKGGLFYQLRVPKKEFVLGESPKGYYSKQLVDVKTTIIGQVTLDGLLPYRFMVSSKTTPSSRRVRELPVPFYMFACLEDLKDELSGINYLGPLRTPAERYYITTFDINPDLDATGKFLPYVLGNIVEEPKVVNVSPGEKTSDTESLSTALSKWLRYFRTGDTNKGLRNRNEIRTNTFKGVLVELAIKSIVEGDIYPLADSGFGYSQVLPIIVKGLLLKPGRTLIVEQPELHLNPSLQVRLAEFFVAMIHAGKHIIIETHSEHIVNTVRVLAAEDVSGDIATTAEIFYFDIKQGVPFIHKLSIKPDGSVPEWPINFFGEAASLTGRLLRAQKQRRNNKEKERGG